MSEMPFAHHVRGVAHVLQDLRHNGYLRRKSADGFADEGEGESRVVRVLACHQRSTRGRTGGMCIIFGEHNAFLCWVRSGVSLREIFFLFLKIWGIPIEARLGVCMGPEGEENSVSATPASSTMIITMLGWFVESAATLYAKQSNTAKTRKRDLGSRSPFISFQSPDKRKKAIRTGAAKRICIN